MKSNRERVLRILTSLILIIPLAGLTACTGMLSEENTMADNWIMDLIGWMNTALHFSSSHARIPSVFASDDQFAVECTKDFFHVLKLEDHQEMMQLFTRKTVQLAEDFDRMIEEANQYITGDVVRIAIIQNNTRESSDGKGHMQKIYYPVVHITTSQTAYCMCAEYRWQNYDDEDGTANEKTGFWFVYIIEQSQMRNPGDLYYAGDCNNRPGLHVGQEDPEPDIEEAITGQLCSALFHDDVNAVMRLFSPAARRDASALKNSTEKAIRLLDGEMVEIRGIKPIRGMGGIKFDDEMGRLTYVWRAEVITTKSFYVIYINYSPRNDWDQELVGIWSVVIRGGNDDLSGLYPRESLADVASGLFLRVED